MLTLVFVTTYNATDTSFFLEISHSILYNFLQIALLSKSPFSGLPSFFKRVYTDDRIHHFLVDCWVFDEIAELLWFGP